MPATLEGMTQDRWSAMSDHEKEQARDLYSLSPQLLGLEGWRVEVVTTYGETRRFYVGRSTGWRPCHIEVLRRDSTGGIGAEKKYASVKRLYLR